MFTPHLRNPFAQLRAYNKTRSHTSMKFLQAAAVLCYHRGATAFVLSSSSVSVLRRSSPTAHVSTSAQQPRQRDGLQGQRRAVRGGATGLRAEAEEVDQEGGLTDEERAIKALLREDFGANVEVDPKRVAVLFDFDGTIGDTETPAMEVAYWELAPYFPEAASECSGLRSAFKREWCLRCLVAWFEVQQVGSQQHYSTSSSDKHMFRDSTCTHVAL